jgi:hypothetical protein
MQFGKYLVKFAVETAIQLRKGGIVLGQNPETRFIPESRIFAMILGVVSEFKVEVLSVGLILYLEPLRTERCGGIEKPIEAYQITHARKLLEM